MYPIQAALRQLTDQLVTVYGDRSVAEHQSWILLEAATGKRRISLLTSEAPLTAEQEQLVRHWVTRITQEQVPLPYILGNAPFFDALLAVEPPLLVPRPATECWVAQLLERLQPLKAAPLRILEIGTGSGCIAHALGTALPTATITAVDIDSRAVRLARKNTEQLANVAVVQADLYGASADKKYDLIVSNPPYLSDHEWDQLDPSVKTWEARHALIGGQQGTELLAQIIQGAPRHLTKKHEIGELWLEIGYTQQQQVAHLLEASGFRVIRMHEDNEGHIRAIQGGYDAAPY